MNSPNNLTALVLGLSIFLGLTSLGYLLGKAAADFKAYERSVTVKGLSEREEPADIVIWPIIFTESGNDLGVLYQSVEAGKKNIEEFLISKGIEATEISHSLPSITDKSAQQYSSGQKAEFRYSAIQTVTVYSSNVATVRKAMNDLSQLGKRGIAFTGGDFQNQTDYLFTGLNKIKPEMIQEATTKAREVALKFAQDSKSKLGKIKKASQGQFSIEPRDKNNPHIKKIRVVSTVEYYLSD
ncbi:MAG: SIMPL domain-containing protein [Gammaproteobacteria bacterium]